MKKIKAVVFDLDNTLVDFVRMKRMASQAAISAMIDSGLEADEKEAEDLLWKLFTEHGIENQTIFSYFLKTITGKEDSKILAAGIVGYRKVKEAFVEPYPKVIPTLIELLRKGYKLGVISDAPRLQVMTRLAGMKMQHFFDEILTIDDIEGGKRTGLPFQKIMARFDCSPEEVMMVGDSMERDIIPAKNLGMVTVLAKYGESWQENVREKPDYEIKAFSEILGLLKNHPI